MTINIVAPDQKSMDLLTKALGLVPAKPLGPIYQSSTQGPIEISMMNQKHRLFAARKILRETLAELTKELEFASDAEALLKFVSVPMADDTRTLVKNLLAEKEVAASTPPAATTPTKFPTLAAAIAKMLAEGNK